MRLDPQQRQEAARDREILELNLSEMPAVSDTSNLHQPKARMFSYRFKTFFWTGIIAGFVFTVIHYWHVKGGWPW